MKNVLVTGATGNAGSLIVESLSRIKYEGKILAGVRDVEKGKYRFENLPADIVKFDFENPQTFKIFDNVDILFLMRPPQISSIERYFKPLIERAADRSVRHIVFLSVQGAERSRIIPHYRIEQLIVKSKIPFTFLRPAYFMQNFTTTLRKELVEKRRIFLPAGAASFTLVDVRDVADVAVKIICDHSSHAGKAYDLTCTERLTFGEMAGKLSKILSVGIEYKSPGLIKFYLTKRRENIPGALILVMILLHYLPRFQKEPVITTCIRDITGHEPVSFEEFIKDNQVLLTR